jgi:hypothetical protein
VLLQEDLRKMFYAMASWGRARVRVANRTSSDRIPVILTAFDREVSYPPQTCTLNLGISRYIEIDACNRNRLTHIVLNLDAATDDLQLRSYKLYEIIPGSHGARTLVSESARGSWKLGDLDSLYEIADI